MKKKKLTVITFLVAMTKYLRRGNQGTQRLVLAHSWRVQSILVGRHGSRDLRWLLAFLLGSGSRECTGSRAQAIRSLPSDPLPTVRLCPI